MIGMAGDRGWAPKIVEGEDVDSPTTAKYATPTPLLDATRSSIAKATHLTDMDKGAVEVLCTLALKIDTMDVYFDALADDAVDMDLRPPSQDNVSIPTYLKFCESLGLTPAGRAKAVEGAASGKSAGKLSTMKRQRPTG